MTKHTDPHLLRRFSPVIVLLVLGGIIGVVVFVSRESGRDRRPADLGDEYKYDVERYKVIPKEKIGYREIAVMETGFKKVTAIAVDADDSLVVGGDRMVRFYSSSLKPAGTVDIGAAPMALTSSRDGLFLVATKDRVGRLAPGEEVAWLLKIPGEKARITSIAADDTYLYIADAGSRRVLRYTRDGQARGLIGDRNKARDLPGFAVPSPYFDVLAAPDGLLRIVDPGRKTINAFTPDGELELSFGNPTFALEGFSGCCNPAHLSMLPDGSYVTSEKGIPRVKVYNTDGEFVTAVVGMEGLATETEPCDVATDSTGRIYVLDPGAKVVRIFLAGEEADRDK